MRKITVVAAAAALLFASSARADVQLTIQNGLVSLDAQDATLRQILAEWGRVGQTKIVNGDRVPGGPLTLKFSDMPEDRALEVLLRTVSGYLAAPRATSQTNASRFDRIVVMPTVAAPRPAAPAASAAPPVMPQPRFVPQPTVDDQNQNDDAQRIAFPGQPGAARPPVFNPFQQPQVQQPPPPGAAPDAPQGGAPPAPVMSSTPTAPPGVSVPGMIVPATPPPGQQGQPQVVPNQPQGQPR
jgi:hypothetical protein